MLRGSWKARHVETKARVSTHHLGFDRPVLATEIGERAPEAKPGVRRRCRDLIEQVNELADRDLLQHPQIDRARQIVIAVALQPLLDRLRELDQLDGIESGVCQRPRFGATQAEPMQPGVRTAALGRPRSAVRVEN